jgi:hypothetical protein
VKNAQRAVEAVIRLPGDASTEADLAWNVALRVISVPALEPPTPIREGFMVSQLEK